MRITEYPADGPATGVVSVIKPKSPDAKGWEYEGQVCKRFTLGYEGNAWRLPSQGIIVISAVEVARDPDDIDKGPEYHISISKNGGRCSRNEARYVLKCFGMTDAEEDNHVPGGFVRNFWLPVNENLIGHTCPCQDDEPAMKEDKGDFVWRGITR